MARESVKELARFHLAASSFFSSHQERAKSAVLGPWGFTVSQKLTEKILGRTRRSNAGGGVTPWHYKLIG